MAKAQSSNPKDKDAPSFEGPRHHRNLVAAIPCLALAILITYWLSFYVQTESGMHTSAASSEVINGKIEHREFVATGTQRLGIIGDYYSAGSVWLLGGMGWLIPVYLFWMTTIFVRRARHLTGTRTVALIGCLLSGCALLAMQDTIFADSNYFQDGPGGVLGKVLYKDVFETLLGSFGSALILGSVYFTCMLFIFTRDIGMEFERLVHMFLEWRAHRAALKAARAEEMRKRREEDVKARLAATAAAKAAPTPPAALSPGTSRKLVVPKAGDPFTEQPKTAVVPLAERPAVEPKPTRPPLKPAEPATDTKSLAVAAG